MNKDKKNKQFGYLFFFVLSFISIFIFFNSNKINYILISLSLIFFLFLTPLSFIVRMMGKDLLNTKFSKQKSYWIKREKNIGTMDKQY